MLTITVDGIPLHYRDVGQGLPVLLLHAFPLNGSAFDAQVKALSGRYRFIVPDHRGFGQSRLGEGPTEMERIARDAVALLDQELRQKAQSGLWRPELGRKVVGQNENAQRPACRRPSG